MPYIEAEIRERERLARLDELKRLQEECHNLWFKQHLERRIAALEQEMSTPSLKELEERWRSVSIGSKGAHKYDIQKECADELAAIRKAMLAEVETWPHEHDKCAGYNDCRRCRMNRLINENWRDRLERLEREQEREAVWAKHGGNT